MRDLCTRPHLLTPTPKAAMRVLEFFAAQIDNDHARKVRLHRSAYGEAAHARL